MKIVGNGVHSRYYDAKFIPLDCDGRLFIKKVKKHWWSTWKYLSFIHEDKRYMRTYVRDEMTNYFKPSNGIYWNEENCIK